MSRKRRVAAVTGDGRIISLDQDTPDLLDGMVKVDVHASLVSPGTELGGWRSLLQKRLNPAPQSGPTPFGYSAAGLVTAVGQGVERLSVGDRVACIGAGSALHADTIVLGHHLCVPLPEAVSFADGSYAMLAATALNAVRRAEPDLGEVAAVVGLGLVGQLVGRMLQLAGNYVIGWDTIAWRTALAGRMGLGVVAVGRDDAVACTKDFAAGAGLDLAVLAFGGDGEKALRDVMACMKVSPDTHRMGRIVIVGGIPLTVPYTPMNLDIRYAGRTGPGYHDKAWERGADYPPVFMRWTTRTNIELCLRWIAEGRLDVQAMTTHTVPFSRLEAAVDEMLSGDVDEILGVVFDMKA